VNCLDLVSQRSAEPGEPATIGPLRGLPKPRADQRFAAMEQDLPRRHFGDSWGGLTRRATPPPQLPRGEQAGNPVDAHSRWVAGYQKEQPRVGVCDEVVEAVDTVVPRSIRDKKGMGILNNDEPRSISARGGIGPAVGIGRRRMRNGERPMKAR